MKKVWSWLLAAATITACGTSDSFTVTGKFVNPGDNKKVFLYGLNDGQMIPIDSTVLSASGEFKFTRRVTGADFYRVGAGNSEYMFIAKNGDDVSLDADLTDPQQNYKIEGGEDIDKLTEFNKLRGEFGKKLAAIQQRFEAEVEANPAQRSVIYQRIQPEYRSIEAAMHAAVLKFANDNKASLAGFYAANTLSPIEYESELIKFSDAIKGKFAGNAAVEKFNKQMDGLKTVSVGQPAPAFTLPSIDNKPVSLSDFKGKYVLIDFWASWCQPCRQENPNIVRMYNKFKGNNFTILGISLDTDAAAWKQAIAADDLTWTHAGELKDFNGPTVEKYRVQAIPTSYLVDPSGKIIAKNLRAEALDTFLTKTLPK
ncbi:TlpA disulfide reductase family protein [Pedobacter sp. SYP-B3415]|uniref:TlpA disulfide reductase family protein n=1 Tax=Pedobacter sp. SYP-B3415 TaxID=2496641 RepID=UPI00101BED27|nr:TlpA disulfide reductase family protein [Pedobacter sp. SYP-B3415]